MRKSDAKHRSTKRRTPVSDLCLHLFFTYASTRGVLNDKIACITGALFCGDDLFSPSKFSHGRLPKYLIDRRTFRTNRNDPYAGKGTDSKKPPVRPGPISSRFLCPRLPLLLSAPNQNRHATQATGSQKGDNFRVMDRVLIGAFDITAASQYLWV